MQVLLQKYNKEKWQILYILPLYLLKSPLISKNVNFLLTEAFCIVFILFLPVRDI